MKIKIVVRPEDAQNAEATAENARRMRQRRARGGLAALLGLVALSAAIAFFFIGRGTPSGPEEQPVAPAPAAMGSGAELATPSEPAGAASTESSGDGGKSAVPAAPNAGETPPEEGAEAAEHAGSAAAAPAGDGREAPVEPAAPGDTAGHERGALPAPAVPPPAGKPSPAAPWSAASAPVVAKVPTKPVKGLVRAQLASRVVNREPVDALQSPVNVGAGGRNVYYFNEFRNLSGQTMTHRWEYNGRLMAAIPFRIEGNRWRVYSSKRIGQNQSGKWRVTTMDKAGAVLAGAEFRAE